MWATFVSHIKIINMECLVEEWKPVKGYEGKYEISSLGRVKSLSRQMWNGFKFWESKEVVLKQQLNPKNGYLHVGLSDENRNGKTITIHKLVAMTFLNHSRCGFKIVVDHIDSNKHNNNVNNLRLVTSRFNLSKDKKNKTSKYVGVSKNKYGTKKWRGQVRFNGEIHYLDCETEEEAYIEYKKLLEKFNIPNFNEL
jgi:hypothetical protein